MGSIENDENKSELEELMKMGRSQLWEQIQHDFIELYLIMKPRFIKSFVKNFISVNNVEIPPNIHVRAYKKLLESDNKSIKRKLNKPFIGLSTLQNKITWFNELSSDEQRTYLNNVFVKKHRGGKRDENTKVTDDTLKCLITLALDFPTMSSESYSIYINSRFGPNHANKISERTVQRYLSFLDFKLKKVSFAPPNRNSIGLRVFRVAWAMIMEQVSKEENILLGFIDEASITNFDGKRYGRAFAGITPLKIRQLKKVKMTVIAAVFPGFGVIYKIINKSANGTDYANFLGEVVTFCREYLCNNETEIILIEDNCPMHSKQDVDEIIKELKFSLIPIVPYSPSLNGVVESYFGFIKLHDFDRTFQDDDNSIKINIIKNWKKISNDEFDPDKSIKFFQEWLYRLQACKRGEPIYSEHCYPEKIEFDFDKLCKLRVNRFYK